MAATFFFFFFLDLHGWEFAAPVSCAGYNSNKWHTETSVHTENIKIFLRAHLTFFLFWTSCCPLLFCNVQTVLTASSVISPMRTPFFFFSIVGYNRPCSRDAEHVGFVLLMRHGSCTKRLRIYPAVFPPSTRVWPYNRKHNVVVCHYVYGDYFYEPKVS